MGAYDFLMGAQGVQLPDPMKLAAGAMSLSQLANTNALSQYQLESARRKDAAAQGVGNALGGLDINDDAAVMRALQSAPPEARADILKTVQDARKSQAESRLKGAEADKNAMQTKEIQGKVASGLAYYLTNKPDVSMQDVQAANANAARVGLPPDYFTPPPGSDPRSHWGAIASQGMDAVKQAELAGSAATRFETNRHNVTEEQGQAEGRGLTANRDANTARYQQGELANSNMRARAAAVTADPFGLSGLNTGGGATATPAAPAVPQGVAQGDAELYRVAAADAAKNGQPSFIVGGKTFNTADASPPTGGGSLQAAMQNGLHGDQFLASLPPQIAGIVKAMVEGRQAPPAGAALRAPQIQQLLMLANQYDPSFDATTWGARASMAKDYGDQGPIGKSNLAINTVIGHLGDLKKSADALNNTSITPLNAVVNSVEGAFGDPRYKAFEANAGAVAKELERAYRGTGGSQSDIDAMKGELASSGSPQQMTAVIQKYVDLLQSKIEANADAYRKTMGREPPPLLSDKAQQTRDALSGESKSGQSAPQSQIVDKLPDPASVPRGTRVRDQLTGKILTSDGTSWR
jgi:hypothetical protein